MIQEIRKANKDVHDFAIGKLSTVNTIIKGKNGLWIKSIIEPKFEAYLPFELVSHNESLSQNI